MLAHRGPVASCLSALRRAKPDHPAAQCANQKIGTNFGTLLATGALTGYCLY